MGITRELAEFVAGASLDDIPDAEPRIEPLHRFANRPYVVFGKEYVPNTSVTAVNAGWNTLFPAGIPASTPLIGKCS